MTPTQAARKEIARRAAFNNALATPKQMGMVRTAAISAGLNAEFESHAMHGVGVDNLTKRQAFLLIEFLEECRHV